jgi:hypothetical protein
VTRTTPVAEKSSMKVPCGSKNAVSRNGSVGLELVLDERRDGLCAAFSGVPGSRE